MVLGTLDHRRQNDQVRAQGIRYAHRMKLKAWLTPAEQSRGYKRPQFCWSVISIV